MMCVAVYKWILILLYSYVYMTFNVGMITTNGSFLSIPYLVSERNVNTELNSNSEMLLFLYA